MALQRVRLEQVQAAVPEYGHFGNQLDEMQKAYNEVQIATEGQTVFTVGKKFKTGVNHIKVFVNGLLQEVGEDKSYVETADNEITFNEPLPAGCIVSFYIPGAGSGMVSPYGKWREPVATRDDLPSTGYVGDTRVILDEAKIVVYNDGGWQDISSPLTSWHEEFLAENGQTEFKLQNAYEVGSDTLMVFVNGILKREGWDNDYIELDEHTVVFNDPLQENDLVTFKMIGYAR